MMRVLLSLILILLMAPFVLLGAVVVVVRFSISLGTDLGENLIEFAFTRKDSK